MSASFVDQTPLAFLMADGNLRVPCSRYGHDTATFAKVTA